MSVTYLNKIKQGFTLRRQRVCVSTVSHKIIVTNCDRQTPSEATRTEGRGAPRCFSNFYIS